MVDEFVAAQDLILAEIKELGRINKFQVFENAVPTGTELEYQNGSYLPYVIVGFGGMSEARQDWQGITSSAEDVKWSSVVAFCVGDNPRTVRILKSLMRRKLEGHIPIYGWGELTEVLSGDFGISKPDADLSPLRYGETIAFKSVVDM